MTTINSYVTQADFKAYLTMRGETASSSTADDDVIDDILESVSRYLDDQTGRTFYPRYETRYHSVPDDAGRELMLDDDLLALASITNGDDSALPTTEVYGRPRNRSPYYALVINDGSAYYWSQSTTAGVEYVIDIVGWWGYHDRYGQRAWINAGALAADATAASTTLSLSTTHTCVTGQVWKVDSEILNGSISTNTLTVLTRGDNGSSASTHASGATVYRWSPMQAVQNAVLEIALNAYNSRSGQYTAGNITVTGAGVVIRPADVTPRAQALIDSLRRYA